MVVLLVTFWLTGLIRVFPTSFLRLDERAPAPIMLNKQLCELISRKWQVTQIIRVVARIPLVFARVICRSEKSIKRCRISLLWNEYFR